MQDLSTDLRVHLDAMTKEQAELTSQLRALEARTRRLEAFLRNEGSSCPQPNARANDLHSAAYGERLREFVLTSLADGDERDLDDLKERAQQMGLTTAGASGRSLNIILVNLHRRGVVVRQRNGKWRLHLDRRQLVLPLESRLSGTTEVDLEPEPYRRCA